MAKRAHEDDVPSNLPLEAERGEDDVHNPEKRVRVEDLQPGQEAKPSRPGDWLCPSCNHNNYAFRSSCQKCRTNKDGSDGSVMTGGSSGKHPDDWDCPQCNHLNFASRFNCQRCQTPKPNQMQQQFGGNQRTRPGDWSCMQCHDHNYASRFVCRRCNAPRPQMGPHGFGQQGMMHQGMMHQQNMMQHPQPHQDMKGRMGDWRCPQCNDHNYASRQQCRQCNAEKTEQSVANFERSLQQQSMPSMMHQSVQPMSSNIWGYGGMPNMYGNMANMGNMGNMPQMSHLQGMGNMPNMGMGNMGQMHQGPPNARPGDWMCTQCGDHNYASRVVCRQCQAPKPTQGIGLQGGRPGDWLCSNCQDHNYASRDACRKCNQPKTQEAMKSFMKVAASGSGGKHPGDWNCPSCYHLNYASRTECRQCSTPKAPQE